MSSATRISCLGQSTHHGLALPLLLGERLFLVYAVCLDNARELDRCGGFPRRFGLPFEAFVLRETSSLLHRLPAERIAADARSGTVR